MKASPTVSVFLLEKRGQDEVIQLLMILEVVRAFSRIFGV